jgi:hypothetical protein
LKQPLGAIPGVRGEQQEEEINYALSVQAVDDPDDNASASAAIIDNGAAGAVEDVAQTEDTAPPVLSTPPSNSGGSRKRGVATTACARTSWSKKKKVAAQCCKAGSLIKAARSKSHKKCTEGASRKGEHQQKQTNREHWSGISNQGKLFFLLQISEKRWHRGLWKYELAMQKMLDAPVQTTTH